MKQYFRILAYDKADPFGSINKATELIITAETEETALEKAKKLTKRLSYWTQKISEFPIDNIQEVREAEERRHREWIRNCDSRHDEAMTLFKKEHNDHLDQMERLIKATEGKKK